MTDDPRLQPYRVDVVGFEAALAELRSVRDEVFVGEQGVPITLEHDALDPLCTHVLARLLDGSPPEEVAAIEGRLAHIRTDGCARMASRQIPAVTNLAVPVFGSLGTVIAALSCPFINRLDTVDAPDAERIHGRLGRAIARRFGTDAGRLLAASAPLSPATPGVRRELRSAARVLVVVRAGAHSALELAALRDVAPRGARIAVVVTGVAPNVLTSSDWRDTYAGTPWHKHVPARIEALPV